MTALTGLWADRDRVLDLNPVKYRSLAENDDPRQEYIGLVAEEVAEVDPRLVHYVHGVPDGVMYDRVAVALLAQVKELTARVAVLEAAA